MPKKRHSTEEIIAKLREVEIAVAAEARYRRPVEGSALASRPCIGGAGSMAG